jgi:hypothetical protein
LQVPSFVKLSVVAAFYDACGEVKVDNILIGGGVSQKDPFEVVAIKFSPLYARYFHADARAEEL